MSRSRRSRRRMERQRAKRPARGTKLSPVTRAVLVLGGCIAIVAGVLLLVRASSSTAARLGRVAGILILLGLVAIGVGAIGKL